MTLETKYKLARLAENIAVLLIVSAALWFIVLTVQAVAERFAQ